MTGCTATLTVALVAECPHGFAGSPNEHREDCVLLSPRDGGRMRWFSVEPVVVTCDNPSHPDRDPAADHAHQRGTDNFVSWTDSTPGATPHSDPLVSDAEVQAVALAWFDRIGLSMSKDAARALAEAAARARGDA